MNLYSRIKDILFGLVMLLFAFILLTDPQSDIYILIILVMAIGLAVKGIKDIAFYFTMARHMVGGKIMLFQGVITLDFALFTFSLTDIPRVYILLYLIGVHAFSGVVELLRGMEAKRTVDGPWKLKFSHGVINMLLALACVIFIGNSGTAVIIYATGLIYSAVMRIISAFKRTAFILIE